MSYARDIVDTLVRLLCAAAALTAGNGEHGADTERTDAVPGGGGTSPSLRDIATAAVVASVDAVRADWCSREEPDVHGSSRASLFICAGVTGCLACFGGWQVDDELQTGAAQTSQMMRRIAMPCGPDGLAEAIIDVTCTSGRERDEDEDDNEDEDEERARAMVLSLLRIGGAISLLLLLRTQNPSEDRGRAEPKGHSPGDVDSMRAIYIFRSLLLHGAAGAKLHDMWGLFARGTKSSGAQRQPTCSPEMHTLSPIHVFGTLLHGVFVPRDRLVVIRTLLSEILHLNQYAFYHNAIAAILLSNVSKAVVDAGREASEGAMLSLPGPRAPEGKFNAAAEGLEQVSSSISEVASILDKAFEPLRSSTDDTLVEIVNENLDRFIGGANVIRFVLLNHRGVCECDDCLMKTIGTALTALRRGVRISLDEARSEELGAGGGPLALEILSEVLGRLDEILGVS